MILENLIYLISLCAFLSNYWKSLDIFAAL